MNSDAAPASPLRVAPPASPWLERPETAWLIALVGLLVLYVPTFVGLFQGVWVSESQGHGPIVLGLSIWLLWRRWPQWNDSSDVRPLPTAAAP